ncbi:hypothetical protein JOF56_005092 [Kibdelosporangium banguiense]|uniref:DUF7919 domain-containing protein n=1 Tax=Kibdelosporangium banguiense TaxID=1365924 RepID=A0ABS4TJV8_9PSEU|nr:hypothetical protein [Kibdelosporangium banguiense]MBP2324707.1 hypothetical protein [Kibdelosporangium banguiense]
MTFFPDGTRYETWAGELGEVVAIGWLDPAEPFPLGVVPAELLDALLPLIANPVNMTRGWHICQFCPQPADAFPEPLTVETPDGPAILGSAEIHIDGRGGDRYVAPTLIHHYIQAHRYAPPPSFVDAVLSRRTTEN